MTSFFDTLKKKRDEPKGQPEQPSIDQPPEAPQKASFFSALKANKKLPEQDFREPSKGFGDIALGNIRDIQGQIPTGIASGLLGSYGNLAELTGLNAPEGHINPGEKVQYEMESNILDKLNTPGYKPSLAEIYALSDEDIVPRYSRLPTSRDIGKKIEDLGGPGEPTTEGGSWARRSSEIYGGSLSMGLLNPLPAVFGGTAGEIAKVAGGGPIVQAAAEIAAMLVSQGRSNPLTSSNPIIKARIDTLRKLGYSDKDITLAVNAQKAGSSRVNNAKATRSSNKAFDQAITKSEGLFEDVLSKEFPGIEKGTDYVHRVAGDAYGAVAKEGANLVIKDSIPFIKSATEVVRQLNKNLGRDPDSIPFLNRLKEAVFKSAKNPTAEDMMTFYRELNSRGNWKNPGHMESLINHVKNGIKATFRSAGREGEKLANNFERVNKGVRRAYDAEAVSGLLDKARTVEGVDWKKMLKVLNNKKNVDVFEKGIGKAQTQNLREIAKVSKEVGDFRSSLGKIQQDPNLPSWLKSPTFKAFLYALATGHIKTGLAIGTLGTAKSIYSRLQTKLLTDPKYQAPFTRMLQAIKIQSPVALQRASEAFKEAAEEDDIDLDFLK
jgi:hypothetical protein